MKNINITNIVDPTSLQPFTGNSLKFLQDASSEARAGMIKAFITQNLGSYSLTVPYVISGCVYSGTTPNFAVTAGEIFYGGEYYEVTAVSNYTNIPQFKLDQTQDATADPLDFSDGQTWSVHDIFKFIGEDTVTAKVFDATDLVSAYGAGKLTVQVNDTTQSTTSTSFVNLGASTYTTPSDKARTWLIIAKSVIKTDTSLGITYNGGGIQLHNGTTALDESYSFIDLTGAADELVLISASCNYVGSIPAGTTINMRMKSSGGGNTEFQLNSFTMVEL